MKYCKPVDVAQLIAEHERMHKLMQAEVKYNKAIDEGIDALLVAHQSTLGSEPTSQVASPVEAYVIVAFALLDDMEEPRA